MPALVLPRTTGSNIACRPRGRTHWRCAPRDSGGRVRKCRPRSDGSARRAVPPTPGLLPRTLRVSAWRDPRHCASRRPATWAPRNEFRPHAHVRGRAHADPAAGIRRAPGRREPRTVGKAPCVAKACRPSAERWLEALRDSGSLARDVPERVGVRVRFDGARRYEHVGRLAGDELPPRAEATPHASPRPTLRRHGPRCREETP